ncbi:calmodulin-A [Drosophila elegans]|uniref:calmodulin-A n=1 Tax=Drosophila elegans TaxID=30023 RepID=UPI0007E61E5D|nr:calmodulin-A [Drosophila elegans]
MPSSSTHTKPLTNEQVEELKDAFERYDLDSNGTLSATEIRMALISMGHEVTEAELYDLIRSVVGTNEPVLNFPKFLQMMAPRLADVESDESLERIFNLLDRDRDGYVSCQDVSAIMVFLGAVVTDDETMDIFRSVDMDGDGRISQRDFISFMHSPT